MPFTSLCAAIIEKTPASTAFLYGGKKISFIVLWDISMGDKFNPLIGSLPAIRCFAQAMTLLGPVKLSC